MAGIVRNHLDVNAMVDDHEMFFHATGQRDWSWLTSTLSGVLASSIEGMVLEVPAETEFSIDGLRDCSEDKWDAGPDVVGTVFKRRTLSLARRDSGSRGRVCAHDRTNDDPDLRAVHDGHGR